jgi:uroporphyrinogen-III synthase
MTVGDWSKTVFYGVGTATTTALHKIATSYPNSSLAPTDVRGGVETGSAEKLAHFVLKDLNIEKGTTRLLYLTGDKNRDTLPSILIEQGVVLETLQVYKTRGSRTFRRDLIDALERFSTRKCLCLFSHFVIPKRSDTCSHQ